MTSFHLHGEKDGLIIDIVRNWPVTWITGEDGKPFDRLRDAVRAVIELPTRYVPYGCPKPDAEGKCPGHSEDDVVAPC